MLTLFWELLLLPSPLPLQVVTWKGDGREGDGDVPQLFSAGTSKGIGVFLRGILKKCNIYIYLYNVAFT